MKGYEAMIQAQFDNQWLECPKCEYKCKWASEMLKHNWEKHDKANDKRTKDE